MKTFVKESQKQKIKKECHQLWVEYGLLPGKLEDRVYQRINSCLPVPTSFVPDAYIDNCIGFVRDECKNYSELRKIDSRNVPKMKNVLTPDEFADRMRECANLAENCDEEEAHGKADQLMTDTLTALGYKEGCDIFDDMPKWYA